jgi:hypothetical protein
MPVSVMLVLWRGPKKIKYGAAFLCYGGGQKKIKYGAAFSRNLNIIIRGALMVNPKNLAFFCPPHPNGFVPASRGVFTKLEYLILNHKRPRGTPVRTQIKASR